MSNRRIIFSFLMLSLHFLMGSAVEGKILPLDEFIKVASESDTEFDEILINELTLKYQKDLRLPPRDLVASVKEEYHYYGSQDRGEWGSTFGLSKLFPYTGTEIDASYTITPSINSPLSSSDFSVSLAHPIAKNAFGRSTRYLDKIVGLEVDVARFQITEAYEDYLSDLISAYLDWYEDYENYRIGESSYQENLKLLKNIKAREKQQIALPIDVNKIKLQVSAKEEDLIALEEQLKTSLNIIEKHIRREEPEPIIPELPHLLMQPKGSLEVELSVFKDKSRTYEIMRLLEKKSSLSVARTADAILPSINLLLGYDIDGQDTGLKQNTDTVKAGLSLAWPVRDQVRRAEQEISQITEERTRLSNVNTHYRLSTDIKNLYTRIQREKKLIEIAEKKIKLAQSVLEDETQNYVFGKVTLNDFIRSVNLVDSNLFNKTSHDIRHKRLILELARLTDRLITRDQIQAPRTQ